MIFGSPGWKFPVPSEQSIAIPAYLDVGAILIIVAIVLSSARNTFDLLGLKTKEPDFWVI